MELNLMMTARLPVHKINKLIEKKECEFEIVIILNISFKKTNKSEW